MVKRLFILSGQSNMELLDPAVSFVPAVERAYGRDGVIVVKDAKGGEPIYRWSRGWRAPDGRDPDPAEVGDLYDRLMAKVRAATDGAVIDAVTFIWMQGERDARGGWAEVYADAFAGLIGQLAGDLAWPADRINVVIGRLTRFGMENPDYPHWARMRAVQEELAASSPRYAWVDCDDLNTGLNADGQQVTNDLHYTVDGYRILGERFARAAIRLVDSYAG